jgi:hypothetical protein
VSCSCRRRSRQSSRLGWARGITVFSEHTTMEPTGRCTSCLLAQKDSIYGIRLSYCSFYLSRALQASVSMKFGAGGCSFRSVFNYRPAVPSDSPAFALLSNFLLKHNRYRKKPMTLNFDTRCEEFLQALAGLFRSGRASIRDVDPRGRSLLHVSERACILWIVFLKQDSRKYATTDPTMGT